MFPTLVVKEVFFQFDGYDPVRLPMSLAAAQSITHVRLASSAGVLWFDGPALVSLTLLLLEPMVVPDFHGVQEEGEFGV